VCNAGIRQGASRDKTETSPSLFLAATANWNQFVPVKMFPACNTEKIGKVQVDYEPLF